MIEKASILSGMGIYENGYDQTATLAEFKPHEMEAKEKELFTLVKARMTKLPFNQIDPLIGDEMGKDITGIGIDPNVTGRNRDFLRPFLHPTHVKRIYVRNLIEASSSNAIGIGLADPPKKTC